MPDSPGPDLIAYLASDPDIVTAARAVLNAADLVAFTFAREGLNRLSEAVDILAVAVTAAGLKPEHVPAAAAAVAAHVHRADRLACDTAAAASDT